MVVQMEKYRPVTLEVESLKFNVFKPEEIRKFSVCKVTNTTSFDSIGNPVSGGLYDVSMGPSTRREVCSTCMNDQHDCIGHFGHIELIMPCYNPFFMKTISTILRATCLGCKKLQVSGEIF
jgi:DNA-directed RNA polymerase I subunit RPA1